MWPLLRGNRAANVRRVDYEAFGPAGRHQGVLWSRVRAEQSAVCEYRRAGQRGHYAAVGNREGGGFGGSAGDGAVHDWTGEAYERFHEGWRGCCAEVCREKYPVGDDAGAASGKG
uniref:(northern house mosquito) hypothetical protein n=1 Tax=Culex pipiens TaxID=7175 RepID=A0A8D8KQK5_CULPI